MKFKSTIKILTFFLVFYTLTSCLEEGPMNTPPGESDAIIQMSYNANGGTLVNSGIRYFGAQALTYPPTDEVDTATFAVTLQGVDALSEDLTVTLVTPEEALDDYYYADSIAYEMMPDSLYEFVGSTTGVIKAGESYVEFQVRFFPSKMDLKKNYMLPVTATNNASLPTSSNYGYVYFHAIGNPIGGIYTWDFQRYDCQNGPAACALNSGASFTGEDVVFAPTSETAIKVPTGYYVQPNYLISFTDNEGVLSDFEAEIAPDELKGAFTDNGVTVVKAPVITVDNTDPAHPVYTVTYTVFNGTAYRYCIDTYTKQ